MKLFRAGDHIVCGENVYGGTFRLFDKILQYMGLSFSYVDSRDPQKVADAMTAEDARGARRDADESADASHRHRRRLPRSRIAAMVYSSSTTHSRPLISSDRSRLGADIVFHSTTKYLNGHSDMIGGCAIVRDDDLGARLQFIHNAAGAVRGAVRRLARAPRDEDPAPSHAAARRERACDRELARRARRSRKRVSTSACPRIRSTSSQSVR